ncbi:hypothetical protein [Mesorhizobium ciceri]|uniref:hypothetical protein n=1 Tax=Mesorhizobium TaxID=68287 RepID=UPI00047A8E74|nr:hypothetical protein [Mesorhizobium ciceri]
MLGTVWSDCWRDCWTDCWADAVTPPIATLILGAIRIVPVLAGSARMVAALTDDGVTTGPLLQGSIETDRSDP